MPLARLATALLLLGPAPALAQTSSYIDVTGPQCRPVRGDDGTRECPGLRINGDHASDIVTLRLPGSGPAVPVSAPSTEGLGSVSGRVEWRLAEGRPYALILWRRLQDEATFRPIGSRLEVHRISASAVCYLGEARGAEENARARQIADAGAAHACP
jgi:hypothetical protein